MWVSNLTSRPSSLLAQVVGYWIRNWSFVTPGLTEGWNLQIRHKICGRCLICEFLTPSQSEGPRTVLKPEA